MSDRGFKCLNFMGLNELPITIRYHIMEYSNVKLCLKLCVKLVKLCITNQAIKREERTQKNILT